MKPIPGYPNYCITRDGRVWSKPRRGSGNNLSGRWLHSFIWGKYRFVQLWKNNKGHMKKICWLLLDTFIAPRPLNAVCRHLNGDSLNDNLENLCWGSQKENIKDALKHGTAHCLQVGWVRKGKNNGRSKMTDSKVKVMRYLRYVAKFSIKDLMWQFDLGKTTVKDICSGKTWSHVIG